MYAGPHINTTACSDLQVNMSGQFEHDCPQYVQWPLSYQSWYLLVGHVFYDYRSIIIMKNIDNFRILKLSVCYVLFVVYLNPVNKVNSLILTL